MFRTAHRLLALTLLGSALGLANAARADLILTIEAPTVQATSVAPVTTETFDGFNAGYFGGPLVTSIGTFASANFINNADQYGGAGGVGKYLAIGNAAGGISNTLTLNGDQAYLGFWWSAADVGNNVDLYSGGDLLGHLDSATVLASLNLDPDYFGNPNAAFLGQNASEPYVYVNIFGTSGTTFDTLVFTNTNLGTLFEIDNISVSAVQIPPPYPGTIIPGGVRSVPEPGSLFLSGLGGLGALLYARLRRRASAF